VEDPEALVDSVCPVGPPAGLCCPPALSRPPAADVAGAPCSPEVADGSPVAPEADDDGEPCAAADSSPIDSDSAEDGVGLVLGDPDGWLEGWLCGVGELGGVGGVGTEVGDELLDAHPTWIAAAPASSKTLKVLATWTAMVRWARRYLSPPNVRTV
jgi:hypothetical protein